MKKGFTLIELLAVIIVLAIVALIATPIVLDVIEDSKKSTAESEANLVLSGLTSYCNSEDFKIEAGTLTEEERKCKEEITEETIKELVPNISSTTKIEDVEYKNGKIISLKVESNGHKFELNENGTMSEKNEESEQEGYAGANPCTYNGDLVQGAEYVNGQYTYRYMQQANWSGWQNIETDGWGVTLTDKESEDAVTSTLCSSINNKPIVSMQYMFYESNTTSIDVSSFDTSNVTNMRSMFSSMSSEYDEEFITITGLTNFDTSNVTDMSSMFSVIISSVDVSNFNTSKVTNMSSMFSGSYTSVSITGLQNFDTSNVTNMAGMFAFQSVGDLPWDTSKVTDMSGMFNYGSVGDITSFDTSNVTDMSYMFANGGSTNKDGAFDLSSFDTSKANLSGMFYQGDNGSIVVTAYARTQEDADRLNNTEVTNLEGNPFVVKPS